MGSYFSFLYNISFYYSVLFHIIILDAILQLLPQLNFESIKFLLFVKNICLIFKHYIKLLLGFPFYTVFMKVFLST